MRERNRYRNVNKERGKDEHKKEGKNICNMKKIEKVH